MTADAEHFEPPRSTLLRDRRRRPQDDPEALVGRTFGHWRVEGTERRQGSTAACRAACSSCGHVEVLSASEVLMEAVCLECFAGAPEKIDRHSARRLARLAAVPRLDPDVPGDRDAAFLAWMDLHPGASSLEEVGRAFGISRERARQLEQTAIAKLHRRVMGAGYGPEGVG